ncbi:hypothetical protein DXA74_00450 [Bacteroides sp. OF04-15BH]|nr:hypothetical protein DXA74_00450 [Bacteroides sp. OF04-15BH]
MNPARVPFFFKDSYSLQIIRSLSKKIKGDSRNGKPALRKQTKKGCPAKWQSIPFNFFRSILIRTT